MGMCLLFFKYWVTPLFSPRASVKNVLYLYFILSFRFIREKKEIKNITIHNVGALTDILIMKKNRIDIEIKNFIKFDLSPIKVEIKINIKIIIKNNFLYFFNKHINSNIKNTNFMIPITHNVLFTKKTRNSSRINSFFYKILKPKIISNKTSARTTVSIIDHEVNIIFSKVIGCF